MACHDNRDDPLHDGHVPPCRWILPERSEGEVAVHNRVTTLFLVCAFVAAGCVGPARSESDYRADVSNTAKAAISAVESAQLVVKAVVDGKAAAAYISRRLTEDEQEVQSTITTFASVQPPTARMDGLRSEVLNLLERANTVLGQMRVAAFRDDHVEMVSIARALPAISSELSRYQHQRGG